MKIYRIEYVKYDYFSILLLNIDIYSVSIFTLVYKLLYDLRIDEYLIDICMQRLLYLFEKKITRF